MIPWVQAALAAWGGEDRSPAEEPRPDWSQTDVPPPGLRFSPIGLLACTAALRCWLKGLASGSLLQGRPGSLSLTDGAGGFLPGAPLAAWAWQTRIAFGAPVPSATPLTAKGPELRGRRPGLTKQQSNAGRSGVFLLAG